MGFIQILCTMDEQMEMDTEQAQLMFQLRQLHLKDASSSASPSPSEMSSTSGARGSNDSGFGSDKVTCHKIQNNLFLF